MNAPQPYPDRYLALRDGPEIEVKVKGSVFLGQALRAASEDDVTRRLDAIRRRTHDATHHCWACRLGPPLALIERSDDDGEPSGTAGLPILAPLQQAELHRALVVVVRWFGGTKLGTGGLARAYREAARLAVAAAPRIRIVRERTVEVLVGYDDIGLVEALLAREAESVRGVIRDFEAEVRIRVRTASSRAPGLASSLVEVTAGRARWELGPETDGPPEPAR